MNLQFDECVVEVDMPLRHVVVTWGERLDFATAYSFLLSYNYHKTFPEFGMLVDFRTVRDMLLLTHEVMSLAQVSNKVFGSTTAGRRVAFLLKNSEQVDRAQQYIHVRSSLSDHELCLKFFFDDNEARHWLLDH